MKSVNNLPSVKKHVIYLLLYIHFIFICFPEVLQLCKTCPNLEELDLSDSTSLTCSSVSHVVLHLNYLKHLAISRCYHIPPGCIT